MINIIHITGASGAGKSTLGNKIKALGYRVIETDDINDKNALELIDKKELSRAAVKKMDTQEFVNIINQSDGDIVIVGRIIDMKRVMKQIKRKHVFYGFYLDVDAAIVFKQVNTRHIEKIKIHAKSMIDLLDSIDVTAATKINDIDNVEAIIMHKYKIRLPVLYFFDQIKQNIKDDKAAVRKDKYKIKSASEILIFMVDLRKP